MAFLGLGKGIEGQFRLGLLRTLFWPNHNTGTYQPPSLKATSRCFTPKTQRGQSTVWLVSVAHSCSLLGKISSIFVKWVGCSIIFFCTFLILLYFSHSVFFVCSLHSVGWCIFTNLLNRQPPPYFFTHFQALSSQAASRWGGGLLWSQFTKAVGRVIKKSPIAAIFFLRHLTLFVIPELRDWMESSSNHTNCLFRVWGLMIENVSIFFEGVCI